jgi:CubicO group peptidase (beta-lactamase class C family)
LQHVERGELDLDDIELVHRVCPELDKQGILSGDTVVPRCGRFTLRNLMSHTSGMSYPRLNPVLGAWETRTGHLRFWTGTVDAFNKPTLFEPETAWEYGLGVDWAGIVLERVTGKSLEDIFQEDIFKPLGVDMTFYPTDDMVERLQLVVKRENGVLVRAPAIVEPRRGDIGQLAGGAGLYGTAPAYLRFLRGILASANGNGLLGEAAYKELFTNSVRFQSDSLDLLGGEQVSNDPTKHDLGRMEHSVGFPLTTVDSLHGRKAGSGSWGGAGQTLYWIDPTSDLAVSHCIRSSCI